MVAFGLFVQFVLIPTQISQLSRAILATGVSPRAFPSVAAWGVTVFGAVVAARDVRVALLRARERAANGPDNAQPDAPVREPGARVDLRGLGIFFGVLVLYVALLPVLGHLIATPLAIVAFMVLLGERRVWLLAVTSIGTTVTMSLFFRVLLSTILPTGIFY